MIAEPVQLVMLAIRSSLRLGQQVRQAYVDSTKRRELVLPLPNFFSKVDVAAARNYFGGSGKGHLERVPHVKALLEKLRAPGGELEPGEESEVLVAYSEFRNLERAEAGQLGEAGASLSGAEFNALISIRQWQRGTDPNPSTLQRLAGTFVEIGIDYFASVPGALNPNSRHAKAVEGFLGAMSELNFAEGRLGEVPGRLFVAVLETVAEHPDLLSGDPKVGELVQVTTRSLSADVGRRLEQLGGGNLVKARKVEDWADLVFRSVLSSAGGLVLSDPQRFLGVDRPGDAALVGQVGESVLGLVLENDGLHLERLLSREGLEKITKTALTVAGEHPEIFRTNKAALQKLLGSIATELSGFDTLLTPDILPELTRMILAKTGENLPLLWPDLAQKPEKHLLLTATQTTLKLLTRPPAAGDKWSVHLGSAELLLVTETVLGELTTNPSWLLDRAGKLNNNLKDALETALTIVRNHADHRLSPATATAVLRVVITKVAMRKEFFDAMPAGTDEAGKRIFAVVLETLLGAVFSDQLDERAVWQVVRSETITAVINIGFEQLANARLTADKVADFVTFIEQWMSSVGGGEPLDLASFETRLRESLAA